VNDLSLESKIKKMRKKHLFLGIAALLVAGGLWLARSAWRAPASHPSRISGTGPEAPRDHPSSGQQLRPPDQTRKFRDFTPEQRVEFARKGQGPGG
jgi:hypothetical protein